VCTLGQPGHGKTPLAAALSTVLAKKYGGTAHSFDQITSSTPIEYQSAVRRFSHFDCPRDSDDVRKMLTNNIEVAILVIDATYGPEELTREHLDLALVWVSRRFCYFFQ
jgi:elongation factor Tu